MKSSFVGWATGLDVRDDNTRLATEVQALCEVRRNILQFGTDDCAMDVAELAKLLVDELNNAKRDREGADPWLPPDRLRMNVLIPTTLPSVSTSGPPLFPGLIGASVWI